MIQFNLLPDVKQQYIKARRSKRTVLLVSIMVGGGSLAFLIALLVGVYGFQRTHMNNLRDDIKKKSEQLKSEPNLDKILTIQNQLNSLDDLYKDRPVGSRIFNFMNKISPADITISNINLDFEKSTIYLTGDASNLTEINKFVDTIKFTDIKPEGEQQSRAFKNVVLSSNSLGDQEKGTRASYAINFEFNPVIFNIEKNIDLIITKQITTRSETEKPSVLQGRSNTEGAQ